ncbi:MAG: glycosyltransferase, partial [Alphaproteobacteria bacterium]|nr:glycosyltransferase [Alphaproteobacteria bacterium]
RILHIMYDINLGGAENLLYALCSVWACDKNNEHIVLSLNGNNYFDFEKLGIPCYICQKTKRFNASEFVNKKFGEGSISPAMKSSLLWRIPKTMRRILTTPWRILDRPLRRNLQSKINTIQPDIIKAWMYHACFYTHLTASAKLPQIWSIHNDKLLSFHSLEFRIFCRLLPMLQTNAKPRKTIFTSTGSLKHYVGQGYAADKAILIHNGVDTQKFHPSQKMRADKRKELGIGEDNFLIGNFSRFDKMKNLPLLANVFAETLKKHGQARLVLAGLSMDDQNAELMALFSDPIFQGKILFLGERRDMVDLFNAIDCYVLTSHIGETFSLVLLEAAACGVPAITTNVGDVRRLILDKQFVIDSGKTQDFVDGIEKIMSWSNEELQQYATNARQLVQDNHSIESVAEKYMDVFKQALE